MQNIKSIQKHYDKLTARERFALIHAAAQRDDMAERDALVDSAPSKAWKIKSHYGLLQGFQFTSTWYMMEQQADLMLIFWMANTYGDTFETFDMVFEGHKIQTSADELIDKMARRVLARYAAWLDLCQDYKLDPAAKLEIYPRYHEMMLLIGVLDRSAQEMGEEAQPSQEQITAELESMRASVENFVKQWE